MNLANIKNDFFASSPIQNDVHYKMARVSFLPGISHICYSVIFDDKLGDKDARGVTGSKPVTKPLPLESWGSYQFFSCFQNGDTRVPFYNGQKKKCQFYTFKSVK